ncbi:MAG: hypothetical protein WCP55_02050 [Lentisphaerota bacterium]
MISPFSHTDSSTETPHFNTLFESIINEKFNQDEGAEKYMELYDEMVWQFIKELTSNPDGRQKWEVLPAEKVKAVWNDYAKYQFVRDEEAIEEFALTMVRNTAKLQVNTEMAGHSQMDPKEIWSHATDMELTDELEEKIGDFILDNNGQWRISDYGLNKLVPLAFDILSGVDAETKLVDMDRMLQICHMRSDLAAMYIEGGSDTLTDMFKRPGDVYKDAMIKEWD